MTSDIYEFRERLSFSRGVELHDGIIRHLLAIIPGSTGYRQATTAEDKSGTDLWVERRDLPDVSVDFKHRDICPIQRYGSDDVLVETCSVFRRPKNPVLGDQYPERFRESIGWTLDQRKRRDIVVYTWPAAGNRRRFLCLWFPWLLTVTLNNWRNWEFRYGVKEARNVGYSTIWVAVPRLVLIDEIAAITCGEVS